MDMKPFKLDIDELIHDFAEGGSTALADMKRVWLSRMFSFIFEASPSTNLACFMQSLYSHSIGYMASTASLSHRLGGFYCLYCLHETQPFKPPFKIYLSLGELKRLKNLVIDAKKRDIKVGMELDVDMLKKISTDYAVAKELAIKEAGDAVNVQNIKHIAEDKSLIGDVVEKTSEDWNAQKEMFYQQTGFRQRPAQEPQQQEKNGTLEQLKGNETSEEQEDDDDFGKELEEALQFEDDDE
ncbi:hypothetical protein RJ639_032033 [Escallonia herrerae]|uniref:Uncharacterized protein n=1 Tax=Escallonia herrerae TaxID=1293975 RepID=A0AA89BCB8_9ASTE|nr:hypothetical protein RJ639_032033 [Escallonia herrerae]